MYRIRINDFLKNGPGHSAFFINFFSALPYLQDSINRIVRRSIFNQISHPRHYAINDIIRQALVSVNVIDG